MQTRAEIKARHFERKRAAAPEVECACGCGTIIKSIDAYGRPQTFVSGHNGRRYYGDAATRRATCKRWAKNNPDKIRDNKRNYYRGRKLKAMEHLGNACSMCGLAYDGTNAPVFEFHHPDPTVKENGVSRIVANNTWEAVCVELDRCVLVCANCHNQHHGGQW